MTGKLTVNGLSKLSGIDNHNGIVTDKLTVNGLSKLSGIDNHNGIRTNELKVLDVNKTQNSLSIYPNWIDFIANDPGNTTKQQWAMYNMNGIMRFWAKDKSRVVDFNP